MLVVITLVIFVMVSSKLDTTTAVAGVFNPKVNA